MFIYSSNDVTQGFSRIAPAPAILLQRLSSESRWLQPPKPLLACAPGSINWSDSGHVVPSQKLCSVLEPA